VRQLKRYDVPRPFADTGTICHSVVMTVEHERLSAARMLLGLLAAAVAGLISYVVLDLGARLLQMAVAAFAFGREWGETQILSTAAFYLFFGLPIALILSVAIGLPAWKRADARPLRSVRDALKWGAGVGALIGIALALLGFIMGLRTYLDDSSSFDSWSYGYQVTHDGIPTLVGWIFELLNVLYLTVAGAFGGLVARWVALPRAMKR
jgi:hypothetical protein